MLPKLGLAALGVAALGWVCAIPACTLALWEVSGCLDNHTATLHTYWDGVWLEWDHQALAQDGSLHFSFYQCLLLLSASFRTWKAVIQAAIVTGVVAMGIAVAGAKWCPKRGPVGVLSGALFVLCGVLMLMPLSWLSHHSHQPVPGVCLPRRHWGAALYLGWISSALMMAGGVFLITCGACSARLSKVDTPI